MAQLFPLLTVSLVASGAIGAYRIVEPTGDGTVAQAAAATDALTGVSGSVAAADTERTDIHKAGIVPVEYGAAVTAGQPLTSDAVGRAVPAVANNRAIGFAEEDGSLGTIGSTLISPHTV